MSVSFPSGGNPFDRIKKLRQDVILGAEDAVTRVCAATKRDAQQRLTDVGRVDKGLLRASIDYEVKYDPTKRVMRGVVFVGAAAFYGVWVEYGRRGALTDPTGGNPKAATAAWPPVDAIRAWVKRKIRDVSGRTKSGRARKAQEKDINRVAFLIGRAIYLHGIKPTPFMTPAFLFWSKQLPKLVNDAVQARKAIK